MPLSSVPYQLLGGIGGGDVEGQVVQAGQDAGLLQVVDAVGEHAGGDDDQEGAGPGEERGQVDPQRAAVDQVAEDDRGERARARRRAAAPGRCRADARGSRPGSPPTGTARSPGPRGRPRARRRRPGDHGRASAARSTWPRSSPQRPRAARAIQKIIQVTKPTATIDRMPPISSWASKVRPRGPKVSSAPKASETTTATATPSPDARQQVSTVGLHQVGDQDADDERGLEALAQADQVVGEHGRHSNTPT